MLYYYLPFRLSEDDGRLCFRPRLYVSIYICMYVCMYVCEQLPGANSSPIVVKLRQSYAWPQGKGDYILQGQGRWGCKRSTEPL